MSIKIGLIFSVILLIVPILATEGPHGKLILMDTNTGASCLDGSPTGYYLKEG